MTWHHSGPYLIAVDGAEVGRVYETTRGSGRWIAVADDRVTTHASQQGAQRAVERRHRERTH